MRRILSTGALLAALTGAALPLTGCEEFSEPSENAFQIDAAVDAGLPEADAVGNPFIDAAPDDAAGDDAASRD